MSRIPQVLALWLALLPAAAVAQAPAGGDKGASGLLAAGEAAFNAGNPQAAADAFGEFLKNYAGLPGTADAVARVKPLLAICQARLGRFDEALPPLEEALKQPDPKLRPDLLFFAGLANLRTGKPDLARKQFGEVFADTKVERSRRMETLVLAGMSYVMEKNWKESIAFFGKHGREIADYSPEAGARAKILLLHSLMQDQQWDEAAALATTMRARMEEIRQVVTFASLTIALGNHFLEAGQFHQAISQLGRVPEKSEILSLQNLRLAEARDDLKAAELAKNPLRASQLQTSVTEMQRELDEFAKIPQFDSAARLRLAGAYFQLGRTREGCLILDQMVRQMEPDEVVESATASLMRGWMSLARHTRAEKTADLYLERLAKLPERPNLADVMFLKAQALEGRFQYQAAADGYREVSKKFPGKPIAAQADFMAAYNILQLEDYAQAGSLLDSQLKQLKPGDEMWPHAVFWRGMAYYYDQKWDDCRKLMEQYLKAEKAGGEYLDDAEFRIAYTRFAETDYPQAIRLLDAFVAKNPQSEWLAEALLTLGDAQAAEGDLGDAEKAYAAIPAAAEGFHDEGWMKRGNLFKARKDFAGMKSLFTEFLEKRPTSPRIPEALQWLGWVAKQQGDLPEAKKIYWDAIARFGNDPVRPGIEDIFIAGQSLYPGEGKAELSNRLKAELIRAKAESRKRCAVRLGWSLARLQPTPQANRDALAALAPDIDPKDTSPTIVADVADALADSPEPSRAAALYEGLRQWWPRAAERERAYAGLGFIAAREGRETEAIAAFDKFEKSSRMPKTPPDERGVSLVEGELGGRVALARAGLLAKRSPDESLNLMLAVQKSKATPAKIRAEAFIQAARLHVAQGRPREALPYFEQVYLLFNRFPALVADAYYERGTVLETLGMPEKAREVFSELVAREDLSGFPPARLAAKRAESLGGIIPPAEPTGGLIPPTPGKP